MDLLSLVGQTTKRKGDLLSQAEGLARKAKTQPKLESYMEGQARVLVKALRDREVRWEEYSRALLDKTLISALASVFLGSRNSNPKETMERAWPTIVGEMVPPLKNFLDETQESLDNGMLLLGDQTYSFADEEPYEDSFYPEEPLLEPPIGSPVPTKPRKKITWMGVHSRVKRYISSPTYAYFALGQNFAKANQGYKEMRRIAKHDSRTCTDCLKYEKKGWQPLGSLPMPGKECRCFDRCRCVIEYR